MEVDLVAPTKSDGPAAPRPPKVTADIARTLAGTELSGSDIVPISSVTGEGVEKLRSRLFEAAGALGARAAQGRFRLAVDRSFVLAGAGTVVTGTLLSGSVAVGDPVMVSPS